MAEFFRPAPSNYSQSYHERHKSEPIYLYRAHRQNARSRNIPFLLTFEEWWLIWEHSGKWDQRGNRRGQYCMARFGDKGAYEIGNVIIILNEENRAERNKNYRLLGENNPAHGQNYYDRLSDEDYQKRVKQTSNYMRERPKSQQMREKLSQSTTGRRKKVMPDGGWTWVKC